MIEAMRAETNLRNEMDEPATRIAEKRAPGRDCGLRRFNTGFFSKEENQVRGKNSYKKIKVAEDFFQAARCRALRSAA